MTGRCGIPAPAGDGAFGAWRGLTRWAGLAVLSLGLLGCSSLSEFGSLFEDEAESTEAVAKAEEKPKEGFPTLQDVPDNPPPATSPQARQDVREGLIADRDKAQYTDERLRAPLGDRPVAPPSPPAAPKDTTPSPTPTASASVSATAAKPVAPPQAPQIVEPPKPPAPPQAPPAGATAPTAPVSSAELKSATSPDDPLPQATATPMIAAMTRGADKTRDRQSYTDRRKDLPASTPLDASPTVDRSGLPKPPDPAMTKGAAAPAATTPAPAAPTQIVAPTPVAPSAVARVASAPPSAVAPTTVRQPETTIISSGNVVQDTFNRQMQASASPQFGAARQAASTPQSPRVAATGAASAAAPAAGSLEPVIILFGTGSSKLSAADRRVVRGVVEQYRSGGGYVRVVGHASSRTRQMTVEQHMLTNFSISLARGQSVAEALIGQGVDPSAIVVEAKGDAEPRYFEAMPNGAARNRRVEIFLEN
jgi:outer membrane protein OmpA-like peptidoglycan-associated protein